MNRAKLVRFFRQQIASTLPRPSHARDHCSTHATPPSFEQAVAKDTSAYSDVPKNAESDERKLYVASEDIECNVSDRTKLLGADTATVSTLLQDDAERKRDQSKHSYRPKVDPKETTLLLFPGQGSQFVGMGKKLLSYPNVKELYESASAVLKYDLLDMCLKGSQSQLDKTVYCQAAVFVTSIAALEKLGEEHPEAIENCVGVAGFSVGEISALVFAGALNFEDALELVRVRAEAMQRCADAEPSGLMTVFQHHDSKLNFALHAAREYCRRARATAPPGSDGSEPVCSIANYLSPECKVIGGHVQALDFIQNNAVEFKLHKLKKLPVSGAFHTRLMAPAADAVKEVLQTLEVLTPILPVHSNVNSFKYKSASVIRKLLPQQLYEPVKWEQTLHVMYERAQGENFPTTYEVGPGRQLGAVLRLVNRRAFASYKNVDV